MEDNFQVCFTPSGRQFKGEFGDTLLQVAQDAEKHFEDLVFKTVIPRNIRLGESPSFGMPILLYDANSAGAKSYFELAKEIMRN